MAANIGPEPHPTGIDVQNIPHGPVYFAMFAGYITLEAQMAQFIGQALAMMLVLFILRLIYKYSLKLTNKLDQGSPGKSAFVKGFFVVLAIAPWVGMFIYVKFYS